MKLKEELLNGTGLSSKTQKYSCFGHNFVEWGCLGARINPQGSVKKSRLFHFYLIVHKRSWLTWSNILFFIKGEKR